MKFNQLFAATLATAALSFGSAASAALVVTPGNNGGGYVSNVVLGCMGTAAESAVTLQGCLNNDKTQLVNFTANETIEASGNGQARIVAKDDGFQSLQISLAALNATFSTLVLNINASTDGMVQFFGVPGDASGTYALKGNGNNFFTITGDDFKSVRFEATGAQDIVADVRQVRLTGVKTTVTPVPEPASLALLGLGLIGMGAARRLRRADKA